MSLSSDSLALRRKRTATERAENNGDPLAVKKKARNAAKSNLAQPETALSTPAMNNAGPAPKTSSNVS
jgi:hypothetical protein